MPATNEANTYAFNDFSLYLDFINRTHLTGAIIHKDGKDIIKGLGVIHTTKEEALANFNELNATGTLHLTLNITNHRGHGLKDIEACGSCLCLDLDRELESSEIKDIIQNNVALVVESSPKKYHVYWSFNGSTLEQWSKYQLALAYKFKGDLNLSKINHLIRVPGFERLTKPTKDSSGNEVKGQKFTPRVVFYNPDALVITDLNVIEVFGDIQELYQAGLKEWEVLKKQTRNDVDKALATGEKVKVGGRNEVLYGRVLSYCIKKKVSDINKAQDYASKVNSTFESELDKAELDKTTKSAFDTAQKIIEENRQKEIAKAEESEKFLEGLEAQHSGFDYSDKEYTDDALLHRVIERYGKLIVDAEDGKYAFESDVWVNQTKTSGILGEYVSNVIYDSLSEEEFYTQHCVNNKGVIDPKLIQKQRHTYLSTNKHLNVLTKLKGKNMLPRALSNFEHLTEHFYLSSMRKVLNLVDRTLEDIRADHYFLNHSEIIYDPSARCDDWLQFLSEIFENNENPEEMVLLLQEIFGYSLTGKIDAQCIFIHYGEGANGKSKVLSALHKLTGRFSKIVAGSYLMQKKSGYTTELNRLAASIEHKRVVIIDDVSASVAWNEEIVKTITGPTLPIRKLYQEELNITNKAKFHLACNTPPTISGTAHAVTRRLLFIPYLRRFEATGAAENRLTQMVNREISGILNWALDGLDRLRERNYVFTQSEDSRTVSSEYNRQSSTTELNLIKILEQVVVINPHTDTSQYMRITDINDQLAKIIESQFPGTPMPSIIALGRLLHGLGVLQTRVTINKQRQRVYNAGLKLNYSAKKNML